MHRYLTRWSLLIALLTMSGCQLTLTVFQVPAAVRPGSVFEVVVRANTDNTPGACGCVLQLPNGFVVLGHISLASVTNDPQLLGLYSAEPGHFLASWSRSGHQGALPQAAIKVFVRAPAGVGSATLKVALAAGLNMASITANSPVGVVDFAQITAAQHPGNVRQLAITEDPSVTFVDDSGGLPLPGNPVQNGSFDGAVLADWNGDGVDDLVAISTQGVHTWARTPTGWDAVNTSTLPVTASSRIAVGDFDGDGFADLASGCGLIWFGDGADSWTAGPPMGLSSPTSGVVVGDVNGDGRDDIAFAGTYDSYAAVRLGNANRTFTAASSGLPTQGGPFAVEPLLLDVTGDGLVDLVANDVFTGDGQGNWSMGSGLAMESWGSAAADLDGDGQPEIIHVSPAVDGLRVFRHVGNNQWNRVVGPPTASVLSVAAADFDRDGRVDLTIVRYLGGVELWRNLGGMQFAQVSDSGLPSAAFANLYDLAIGDFNGDTVPDLVATGQSEGVLAWQNWTGGALPFGSGCQGTLPQPLEIAAIGAPIRGNAAFAVEADGGAPGTLGIVWLGVSSVTWNGQPLLPLALGPIGAPGCTLLTDFDTVCFGLFDTQGRLPLPVPIPNSPSLLRFAFFAQSVANAAGSNAIGLAFSGGLVVRVE